MSKHYLIADLFLKFLLIYYYYYYSFNFIPMKNVAFAYSMVKIDCLMFPFLDLCCIPDALLNSPWTTCGSTGWIKWNVLVIIVIITLIFSHACAEVYSLQSIYPSIMYLLSFYSIIYLSKITFVCDPYIFRWGKRFRKVKWLDWRYTGSDCDETQSPVSWL